MRSLDHGLAQTDASVVQCCLEGLAGLGKFQWQAVQAGRAGLARQAEGGWRVIGFQAKS
jgi:hypothetical protein